MATKGTDQHQERAFGEMKIGEQQVDHLKLKPRGDEDLRVGSG
jgi:hypothetical protein